MFLFYPLRCYMWLLTVRLIIGKIMKCATHNSNTANLSRKEREILIRLIKKI